VLGTAVDIGAQIEHVRVTGERRQNVAQIAGRSMPGSILRTKREMAISAPVLPAETQASASP
jgi:hypothetical protein